jgi:nucleoside-diphosphate-sugar epimerase
MGGHILVIGAAGRFGRAAAAAFRDAGWQVTSQVRRGAGARALAATEIVEADALNRAALTAAARGTDIVLHAANPPYTQWQRQALPLAYAAIEAAESAGATLMFPGNVYNYGAGMPPLLDETTPMRPTSRKGRLRVTIEERMREASDRGMRAIILRAGDFFGGGRGSWFDLVIAKDVARNRITYPGPLDVVHAWAYLPDLAAAMVRLAAVRADLDSFSTFGFPGHAVTGVELARAIARATGRGMRTRRMGWWLVHLLAPIVPMSRELAEMQYLWRVPHRISGAKLQSAIGDIPATPLDHAVADTLRELDAIP